MNTWSLSWRPADGCRPGDPATDPLPSLAGRAGGLVRLSHGHSQAGQRAVAASGAASHLPQECDRWLVYSYATHFATSLADNTQSVRSLGYFVSELEPVGNEYRFRRFSINTWDPGALPWTKPLPWAAADGSATS